MRLFTTVLIVFLSYGYSRAFDDELIGLPIELEGDIWPTLVRQQREENWEETLARLCLNVDLTLNDEVVDCDSLETIPKSLKIDRHEIKKREAEATELEEGSGSAEDEPAEPVLAETVPAETVPAEPVPAEPVLVEPVPAEPVLVEPVPAESVPAEPVPVDTVPAEPVPAEPVPAEPVSVDTVPAETGPAEPVPTEPVPADTVPAETVPAEPVPADTVPAETVPADPVPVDTVLTETVPAEPVPAEPVPADTVPAEPVPAEPVPAEPVPAEPAPAEPVPENPLLAKQLPSETIDKAIATVTSVVPAAATAAEPEAVEHPEPSAEGGSKEAEASENEGMVGEKSGKNYVSKEYLNDKQSGNVVIDGLEGTMEETDAALNKKKFNESLKSTAEEPRAGESTKQAGAGSNTLMIGLFVGVVAIGAAAFAYNYVRKKNRSRGEAAPQADVEEGKEMKPLMRTAGGDATVEYKDEKEQTVKA